MDSLKQEKLLLVQKYKDLKKDLKLETNIFEIFKGFERNEKDFNKFLYSKLVLKYDLEKLKTSQEKKNL
ncbi:MAG: hypothetical protein LBQ59_01060 [Candidatus Peribacteria bacterium]|nr:hypothetical protein [Candidatus Peribacteria bacterium]